MAAAMLVYRSVDAIFSIKHELGPNPNGPWSVAIKLLDGDFSKIDGGFKFALFSNLTHTVFVN